MASDIKNSFEKHKILSLLICIFLLAVDIYFNYYTSFRNNGLSHPILLKIVASIYKTGLLSNAINLKVLVIVLTGLFTLLDRGKKNIELSKKTILIYVLVATISFALTGFIPLIIPNVYVYTLIVIISFAYLIKSYSYFSRLLNIDIMKDRFNKKNKIFPQNTDLIENETSVNIPYKFVKKYNKNDQPIYENGYINLIALERATMVLGKPGSGKSYSFIEEIIRQHIMKGFAMINYDYKFPTLTNVSYNYYNRYNESYDKYKNGGQFKIINLDDPRYSHRCNPVHRDLLTTKAQAVDAVYTLFYNIDKKSASKQDFFQMSAMSITSAALWFLREFNHGKYCSLPHLIEFINRSDEEILTILDNYADLKYFTSAFSDALAKKSFEQLSGQTASARIPLGKLATEQMFYVMAPPEGIDQVDLRINKKENVTILNIANNPETQKTNGPALGLFMSQAAKLINAQNRVPCDFLVDELPTIFINGLNTLIATARSNKVSTVLSIQDYTQIVNEYGKEQADTIFNTTDTIISGKVAIETADKVSKAIGKINYQTQSITVSKEQTSTSISTQRELLVPPEDISQFTQGEFVGIVSDTFKNPIKFKAFRGIVSPSKDDLDNAHCPIINPDLNDEVLKQHSKSIQSDIDYIIKFELERIQNELNEDIEEEKKMVAMEVERELPEDINHIYEDDSVQSVVDLSKSDSNKDIQDNHKTFEDESYEEDQEKVKPQDYIKNLVPNGVDNIDNNEENEQFKDNNDFSALS